MSINRKKLGEVGEKIAADYLQSKGYRIVDKNYFNSWPKFGGGSGPSRGEIDIIAKKDDMISFIEVKADEVKTGIRGQTRVRPYGARPWEGEFCPEDRVNFQKQRKLIKIAQSWLMKNKISFDKKWQIDVISVKIDLGSKKAKIRHFKNAIC